MVLLSLDDGDGDDDQLLLSLDDHLRYTEPRPGLLTVQTGIL